MHLKEFGSITSWEAVKEYGILCLPSRIRELKADGYEIYIKKYNRKNRYGKMITCNRYYLKKTDKFSAILKKFIKKGIKNG